LWRDNPHLFGILHPNYETAFKISKADTSITGYLPQRALDSNSLLREVYRVHDIRGSDTFDGVLRESIPPNKQARLKQDLDMRDAEPRDKEIPHAVVAVQNNGVTGTNEVSSYYICGMMLTLNMICKEAHPSLYSRIFPYLPNYLHLSESGNPCTPEVVCPNAKRQTNGLRLSA